MKKWMLPLAATLLLAACGDENTTDAPDAPAEAEAFESVIEDNTIEVYAVDEPNEDVQAVIGMTDLSTFASFIYSISDVSYLIINTNESIHIDVDDNERVLNIHLTRSGEPTGDVQTKVYAVSFTHQYDTIKLFEDDKEIPFDIWTE